MRMKPNKKQNQNVKKTPVIRYKNTPSQRLSMAAMFLCVALIISLFENALPPIMPALPYAKLGIANCVLLVSVAVLGVRWGLLITIMRCFLVAVFSGNFFQLAFSLPAGIISVCIAGILFVIGKNSLTAISVAGAAVHNLVQVCIGCIVVGSASLFSLLPYMCVFGCIAGIATGLTGYFVIKELF